MFPQVAGPAQGGQETESGARQGATPVLHAPARTRYIAMMPVRDFLDSSPRIAPSAYLDDAAVVIGDVTVGPHSSLWPGVVARGDVNRITIGARTNLQDGTVIHVTGGSPQHPDGHPTLVGDDVTVGHQVVLHGCTVGDRCLIGMGSVIMDGAVLEPAVMLGAGSLVSPGKVLAAGHLWLGRPARRIRPLTAAELEQLEGSAARYVRLKDLHRAMEYD